MMKCNHCLLCLIILISCLFYHMIHCFVSHSNEISSHRLSVMNISPMNRKDSQYAFYQAAVVDYSPYFVMDQSVLSQKQAQEIQLRNLQYFDDIIRDTLEHHPTTQMFVFPEYGLYGVASTHTRELIAPYVEYIPSNDQINKTQPIIPCDKINNQFNVHPILSRASCISKKYGIHLILNMADAVNCKVDDNDSRTNGSCPHFYNTQVAFGTKGQLLAKYHKTNLYYEKQFDAGSGEPVFFESDFGVRFGMLICYDLMFAEPLNGLINHYDVQNIVVSSWWVNYPPIIQALQVQQALSRVLDLNILASNSGYNWFNSGSSIVSRGTVLNFTYNHGMKQESNVIVAGVNRNTSSSQHERKTTFSDSARHHPNYHVGVNVTEVDLISINPNTFLQHELFVTETSTLRCVVNVTLKTTDRYVAVIATSGLQFGLFPGHFCGIIQCGLTAESCESLARFKIKDQEMKSYSKFVDVSIHALLKSSSRNSQPNFRVYPLVTGEYGSIVQIDGTEYEFEEITALESYEIRSVRSSADILSAVVHIRE